MGPGCRRYMPNATRNAVRLSSRTRWFVRRLRPVLTFSILLSFMRIEHPLYDSIGRRKRKSVTPQFAECNSFVTLWTVDPGMSPKAPIHFKLGPAGQKSMGIILTIR